MPWDCKSCDATGTPDDTPECPGCGAVKTSWTMVPDKTRQITVTRGRTLKLLRSEDPGDPLEKGQTYEGAPLCKAESAPAIPKAEAKKLFEAGLGPAPGTLLFARLSPAGYEDLCVQGVAHFQTAEPGVTEVDPGEPTLSEEGTFDVRFLLVYGGDELPEDLAFEGVEVVDVSEATELGHVPKFGVIGLGKKRRDLPVEGLKLVLNYVCQRLNFNTDSAIVRPSGLAVLKGLLSGVQEHPERKLLIAGHTDTEASNDYNQALSEARAKNVLDLLVGDADAWAEDAKRANGSLALDVRETLAWASRYWNFRCAPERLHNGTLSKADAGKITRFKQAFNERFSQKHLVEGDASGAADDQFWLRVLNLYGHALVDMLDLGSGADLQALCDSIAFADDAHRSMGCGEEHPRIATEDEVDEERNRRIDFLFFAPDQVPDPVGDDGRYLEAVYDPARYTIQETDCPPPDIFGEVEPNVVFVIDTSGSMNPFSGNADRPARGDGIGFAKRKLVQVIDDLRAHDRFAVIAYANSARMLWSAGGVPEARAATDSNKDEAIEWVNGLRAEGATRTSDALALAFKATGIDETDGRTKGVKFLSDGRPTPRSRPEPGTPEDEAWWAAQDDASIKTLVADEEAAIDREVEAASAGWIVDTIGFFSGADDDASLVTFMTNLASDETHFTHVDLPVRARS